MDAIPRVPEAFDFLPVQLNLVDTYTNTTTNEVEYERQARRFNATRQPDRARGVPVATRLEAKHRSGTQRCEHRFAFSRYFFQTCDDPAPRKTTRLVQAFLAIRREGAAV